MKKWEIMLASVVLSGTIVSPVFGQDEAQGTDEAASAATVVVEGVQIVDDAVQDDAEDKDEDSGEATDETAEATIEVTGKVIVVGPDGKKSEYQIGDQLPEGLKVLFTPQGKLPAGRTMILHSESKGGEGGDQKTAEVQTITITGEELPAGDAEPEQRLMIGVHCEAASELLRGHLKLENKGLVVIEVVPDSPAAAVGLQKNDLLLKVNDRELSEVTDLLEVVTKSEGHELSVSLLRNGDPLTVQVTPKVMEVPEQVVFGVAEGDLEMLDLANVADREELPEHVREILKNSPGMKRLRMITPGSVMIDKAASPEEIQQMLRDAAEAARAHAAAAHKHAQDAAEAHALEAQRAERAHKRAAQEHRKAQQQKSVEQQLQELQEQINALKEQVHENAARDKSEERK